MMRTLWSNVARKTQRAWYFRPLIEVLEDRCVPSGTGFRPIDEVGNNIAHPTWGNAGIDLIRISPVAYADGRSASSQSNTLSPREISNNLNNQSDPIFSFTDNLGPPQSKDLSDFAYVWGQFIDHDMDLTPTQSGANPETFDILADPTRPNDPMGVEPFTRSAFDPKTGTSTSNPRQQINAVTSFLDLSQVYGSTAVVADALRTFSGGHLKTSPGNLLPYNNTTYFTTAQLAALNMANDAHQVPDSQLFAAGDVRANENIELSAIQTLFVRNHNRLADQLHALHPSWNDETLYQEARKLNIAEEEIITYNEFLPAILGPNALPAYPGYNTGVNPGIATEFSTVGFRFGHSLLSNTVGRNNNDGTNIADVSPLGAGVNLAADFFDPNLITANGAVDPLTGHTSSNIDALLKADADNNANEMDLLLIDEVRNILFGIPHGPGTDLAARDIQRARDHGIGTYNQVRVAYGLPAVTNFAQITSDPKVQTKLRDTYGTVDKIDPFEGMLAEDHLPGADVGPTIKAILAKQFTALRDGDRFFYLNESFNTEEQNLVAQGNILAKVIKNNTPITNLQDNVFFFKASISGTVFLDLDNDGFPRTVGEPGLPGITVNLKNGSGAVIATTKTDAHGSYSFTDQTGLPGTGKYTVSLVLPPVLHQTTANPGTFLISRGDMHMTADFGVNFNSSSQPAITRAGLASSSTPLTIAVTGGGSITPDTLMIDAVDSEFGAPLPVTTPVRVPAASSLPIPAISISSTQTASAAVQAFFQPFMHRAAASRRVDHLFSVLSNGVGERGIFDFLLAEELGSL